MGKSTMMNGHFTRKVKTKSKDNSTMVITENNIHNAWTQVKQLTNALRYFQDAVEKEIHNQLPGASSILLDIVVSCYTELGAYLINKDRSAKMLSATDRVYLSLAELMKWSDRVLIEESSNYNRDEVSLIVGNLKESVNTLVQLCVDHYQSRDNLVKSSTSFSLKNDEVYDDDNQNGDLTDGNTPIKDTINCTNLLSSKASNISNHSDFSLSHHRNSLPSLSTSTSTSPSPSPSTTTTTPKTTIATTVTATPQNSSQISTSIPVNEGITSEFPDKSISTHIAKNKANNHDSQSHSSSEYPPSVRYYASNNSFSSTSSCSERFPHSLSSDSLLNNNSKLIENININLTSANMKLVPQTFNNIYTINMPGGKRGGIIISTNSANSNNFVIGGGRSQISSFTSSCVSSSVSSTGASDYPGLDDIPPPLPPKKKQSLTNELIRSPSKRPSLVDQNSFEMAQTDSTSVSSSSPSLNCQSHHAMSLESFSNLMLSDCNDTHDTSDYRNQQTISQDESSRSVFSSRTVTSTKTIVQQSQHNPISTHPSYHINNINNFQEPRLSKDGLNNQDHNLNSKNLEDTMTDYSEPPELPVKLRRRHLFTNDGIQPEELLRPPSQYDNISDLESTSASNSMTSNSYNTYNERPYKFDWSSASTWQTSNHSISCPLHLSRQADSLSSNGQSAGSNFDDAGECQYEDFSRPPPLPPKQRNIMTYMTMLNGGTKYDGPNDAVLNLYRHSVHTYHLINSASKLCSYQQLETTFNTQRCLKKISSTTTDSEESILSLESSSETSSSCKFVHHRISGDNDSDLEKPPSLPPKAKSQIHLQQQQQQQLNIQKQQLQLQHQSKIVPQEMQTATQLPETRTTINEGSSKFEAHIESNTVDAQPRESSPASLMPSSESGISSQSESIRTTDECQGPLDEIDVSPYLVYKNPDDDGPEIRGGIVDVLIVKATEVSKNDFLFQEAFLTTYRTFISPMELINKLIYRHNKFTNCTDSKQRAAKNSFALLVRVVDDLCISDCSDVLMQTLLEFIYSLVIKGDLALARVLRSKVIEKFDNRRNGLAGNQILLPSVNISSRSWTLHNFKSEIVAEQMTLLDAGLFQKVEVVEYLLWAREQKEELIPNLNKFTEHFNKMSYWARSRIVEIEDPKEREKLVTKFIKIMKHLRKMNNFNSYLALLSALDSGPVRRLEWPKSITESMKDLCSLIDSSSSFRAYRQALAETQPPCIPYIGLILQDLTFVHIGNNDFLSDSEGNNINFAKRWQIFNILDQMRRFKNSHYPFKKNEQVLSFFNDFDNYLSEEAIWQISESIKPRLNNGNSSTSNNTNSSPEKSSTNAKK